MSTLSLALAACNTAPAADTTTNAAAAPTSNTANAVVADVAPDSVAEEANATPTTPIAPAGTPPMGSNILAPAKVFPPAPGTPGGLADDRTPIAEGPIDPKSPQGAAQVVQNYAAFLEAGRFREAWRLWGGDGAASGMTADQFAASFAKYAEIHGQVGAPGNGDGAAGSVYVDVPLQLYGTLRTGNRRFVLTGPVTLRRVNDVDGATPAQLRWHISATALKPVPRR